MRAVGWATAVAAALVVGYLALGGASYAPAEVADPCAPRDWRGPDGVEEVAEQIALSGLDGAACELGVSRERMVLAFASRAALERFARDQGISAVELEELARTGLLRAVDDAWRADAVDSGVADLLRTVVRRIPVEALLDLLAQLPGLEPGR